MKRRYHRVFYEFLHEEPWKAHPDWCEVPFFFNGYHLQVKQLEEQRRIFWKSWQDFGDARKIDRWQQNFWRADKSFGRRILQLPWISGRGVSANGLIKVAFGHISGRETQHPFEITGGQLTEAMMREDEQLYEQGFLTIIPEEHVKNIYARFTVVNSDLTT